MDWKDITKNVLASIGREVKEKLPSVVGEARQQILENMPLWDQGHAQQTQRTSQAHDIHVNVSESNPMGAQIESMKEVLAKFGNHAESMAKSNAETAELLKKHTQGNSDGQSAPKDDPPKGPRMKPS